MGVSQNWGTGIFRSDTGATSESYIDNLQHPIFHTNIRLLLNTRFPTKSGIYMVQKSEKSPIRGPYMGGWDTSMLGKRTS